MVQAYKEALGLNIFASRQPLIIFNAAGHRRTSRTLFELTPMMGLWSSGESDVVRPWLAGRSGYTGMLGLLFV